MTSPTSKAIQSCIATVFDDFTRVKVKPYYWYRRYSPPLYSFIVIAHSSKFRCFEVDVISSVFSIWDRQYGTHQLRRATGLPNLRVGSNSIRMEDVPYKCTETLSGALDVVSEELQQFALPWFDAHHRDMAEDELLQFGLQITNESANFEIDLDELKQLLRKHADRVTASKWQRQEISILAGDLLRWQRERQISDRRCH